MNGDRENVVCDAILRDSALFSLPRDTVLHEYLATIHPSCVMSLLIDYYYKMANFNIMMYFVSLSKIYSIFKQEHNKKRIRFRRRKQLLFYFILSYYGKETQWLTLDGNFVRLFYKEKRERGCWVNDIPSFSCVM